MSPKFILLLIIAMLSGCANPPLKPTQRADWRVTFHLVEDIAATCADITGKTDRNANACVAYHKKAGDADVYLPYPFGYNDSLWMKFTGHEIMHLLYGRFHS